MNMGEIPSEVMQERLNSVRHRKRLLRILIPAAAVLLLAAVALFLVNRGLLAFNF